MQPISIPANSLVYKTGSFLILAGAIPVADALFLMQSGAMQTAFAVPIAFMFAVGSYGVIAGLSDFVKWLRARTTPALLITREGVCDATGVVTGGGVLWSEVQALSKVRDGEQLLLAIYFHDNASYLARLPWWKRFLLSENTRQCGTPFLVAETELSITVDEACVALQNARQIAARESVPEYPAPVPRHWWTAVPPEERSVASVLRAGR